MIQFAAQPQFVDVPDSSFAVDQPAFAATMLQLAHNAKFACVRREVWCGLYSHGQTFPLPISSIDGYQYSYPEITFWWSRHLSGAPPNNKPSGAGDILQWVDSVSADGLVSCDLQYYIDGGQDTPTHDGELMVWAFCQRNAALKLSAIPAFDDVIDSQLAGSSAALASVLEQLNKNIRFAVVRKEFFVGTYGNGAVIPAPVSPVDGYTYQPRELIYVPSLTATLNGGGSRDGGGCIHDFSCSVNPATGVVSSAVNYYVNGGAYGPSNDGQVLVLTIGVRSR